jgi:type II secretory pathway component PulF
MADLVDNGTPLAAAMDAYPAAFPPGYRALVRAGERGGSPGRLLESLAASSGQGERASRGVLAQALYPACLFTMLWVFGIFSTIFLLPSFRRMFEEMEIPGGADLMSAAVSAEPGIAVAFLAAVLAVGLWPAIAGVVRRFAPALAATASWLQWHLPPLAGYERRRAAAGYALAAARLLEHGVPAGEALAIAAAASGSARLERIARRAAGRVEEGQPLSAALSAEARPGELPADFLWYLRAGERSGRLPEALERAAEGAASRAEGLLSRLVDLALPAGILAVALPVGLTAYGLFSTLLTIVEGIAE